MNNARNSTEQLIQRARAGDEGALVELQERMEPELRRRIGRQRKPASSDIDAGPSVDEALQTTWQGLHGFTGTSPSALADWLLGEVMRYLDECGNAPPDSLETLAPTPERDLQTLPPAAADTVPPKRQPPPDATAQDAAARDMGPAGAGSPVDPSSLTTPNRSQGTVVGRSGSSERSPAAENKTEASPAPASSSTTPAGRGSPPAPAEAETAAPRVDPSSQTTPGTSQGTVAARRGPQEIDPPADRPPASAAAPSISDSMDFDYTELAGPAGDDPLATVPPNDKTTISDDPLATFAEGVPAERPREPTYQQFGDYEIMETIAKGGMGVVYKARHRKLNRIVALKMILAGDSAHPDDIERFYVEAKAAAQLDHKNIVGIHELGEIEGQHYISMQFVEGQSLAELVREYSLDPRVAATYMAAISEAMEYAHGHGILHRDLKPGNILVDQENVPLITDFGLAKLNPSSASGDEQARANESSMTIAGQPMGTPSFMPPEQARGNTDQISELSDVYSLGATLYHLLTGKPPFAAADVFKTMEQVLKEEPISPRVLNASVPKDLETICLKCLQKPTDRRYRSAQELADELRRYLAGEPIQARPVGVVERTIRWCYRNPWPTAAICASLFGLVVATSLWWMAVRARNDADAANLVAQQERAEAVAARDQARASRSQLFAAINDLFTTWGDVKLLNEPALADVRQELLTAATELYAEIAEKLGDDPELRQELGGSYYRLALMMFHMEGYREAEEAVASARDTLEVNDLTTVTRSLAAVTDPQALGDWGEILTLSGNIKVKLSHGADNPAERLALLDQALGFYGTAVAVRERLTVLVPEEIEYKRQLVNVHMNVGTVLRWKGDVHDQLSFQLQDDAAAAKAQFDLMESYFEEAKDVFQSVHEQRRELLVEAPGTLSIRHDLAKGDYNLANIARLLAKYDLAESVVEQSMQEFVGLLSDRPGDLQSRFELARCEQLAGKIAADWLWLADSASRQRMLYDNALSHYTRAAGIYTSLDGQSPAIVTRYRVALGILHTRIGELYSDVSQHEAARTSYQTAIDLLQPLQEAHPDSGQIKGALADAQQSLARLSEAPPDTPPDPAKSADAEPPGEGNASVEDGPTSREQP